LFDVAQKNTFYSWYAATVVDDALPGFEEIVGLLTYLKPNWVLRAAKWPVVESKEISNVSLTCNARRYRELDQFFCQRI